MFPSFLSGHSGAASTSKKITHLVVCFCGWTSVALAAVAKPTPTAAAGAKPTPAATTLATPIATPIATPGATPTATPQGASVTPTPAATADAGKNDATTLTPFTDLTLDGILVTVNDDVLLLSDVQRAVLVGSQGRTQLLPTGRLVGGSLTPQQAEQLLDQLIDSRILHMRVTEMGMSVSEDELDQEIAQFLKQQNIPENKFDDMLRAEGETRATHREEFRKQIEMQRFIGRVIRPQVIVTDDEVRSFVMQTSGAGGGGVGKVKLKSLLIEMPANLSPAQRQQKLQKVERVTQELADGKDFVTLVKLLSESSDAAKNGGELPPRMPKELPPALQDKLATAKPNDVIGPLTIGASVFFFQFLGQEQGGNASVAQPELVKNREKLQELKFQERLHENLQAERSKARIITRPFKFSQ